MILEKSFAKSFAKSFGIGLLTTDARRSLAISILSLITFGVGCASSGSLQPHQAFRQGITPYQGYYQGQQTSLGAGSGLTTPTTTAIPGYRGFNNSLPSFEPSNVASGSFGAIGNQPASSFGSLSRGQAPTQVGYPQYLPNASYNFQPAYAGGFTSGSC